MEKHGITSSNENDAFDILDKTSSGMGDILVVMGPVVAADLVQ
jgi:hypothetical protein